jgi:hypothetical protein
LSHLNGNGPISPGSVIRSGCRPSRIPDTMSGASSVRRSRRETWDELSRSAAAG